jgi:hypothetical protein
VAIAATVEGCVLALEPIRSFLFDVGCEVFKVSLNQEIGGEGSISATSVLRSTKVR